MHATSNVDFAFCSLLLSMRKVPLTLPSLNLGLNLFFHTRHSVLGVFLLWSLRSTGGGGLEVLDVWSWISTVCCSPLKGNWDRFACCLVVVVVKKGFYWFLMFSLIAKLRTYCECDHITIMTPCSAKVLLYLKTRNLVTLWFQFADRVVWWVEEFFHSIFLCGAVAFLTLTAHFFIPDPHLYVCGPGRAHWGAEVEFLLVLSMLLWCRCSHQAPGGRLVGFSSRKATLLFSIAQFLPVLRIFTLEPNPKQNRRGPWWRWRGGVFVSVAEAIWCFHWLRCLQLFGMELFILITSLVFFHHVHVWLDWYGCVCVCVRVCS